MSNDKRISGDRLGWYLLTAVVVGGLALVALVAWWLL